MNWFHGLLMVCLLVASLAACRSDLKRGIESVPGYQYQIPVDLGEGWETASLEAVGIDSQAMAAMIQEGVTFSLGVLTPGGDAAWIAAAGIPKNEILLLGVTLLTGGAVYIATLLPLAGIQRGEPWGKVYPILLLGMCSLMLVRWIHSLLVAPQYSLENTIPLIFSCMLALCVAALFRPVTARMRYDSPKDAKPVPQSALLFGLALGVGMFVFQMVAIN